MSLTKFDPGPASRAERQFSEAFERLKKGKPQILPKGSKITQNNVAREAGVDPSALRAKRFPALVKTIQQWVDERQGDQDQKSPRQMMLAQRSRNRSLREQMDDLTKQRDDALSKLVDAEARLVALTMENERLRTRLPASTVTPIRPANKN